MPIKSWAMPVPIGGEGGRIDFVECVKEIRSSLCAERLHEIREHTRPPGIPSFFPFNSQDSTSTRRVRGFTRSRRTSHPYCWIHALKKLGRNLRTPDPFSKFSSSPSHPSELSATRWNPPFKASARSIEICYVRRKVDDTCWGTRLERADTQLGQASSATN
ncbi:hypothetical protein B0H19DRAFT_1060642 [Mycena capillaripes]|nr:hypothetical protein B0H19DRAFT_1060642 [Mycena capillaripes]